MTRSSPSLPELLSKALVSFTIELDNEFELRMPHRTTRYGGDRRSPWLVSLAMWFNCMRFVGDEGITARELEKLARTFTNLRGLEPWGYITKRDRLIRAKPGGHRAREVWLALLPEIESRWPNAQQLRKSLLPLLDRIDLDLPDFMPILGYGLYSKVEPIPRQGPLDPNLPLPALLSKTLLAFAVEFESESKISLAICANVLRVLDETGVPVRELPHLSGVSKELIAIALNFLQKFDLVAVEPGRVKLAGLTRKGVEAQQRYRQLLADIEIRWHERFGADAISKVRQELERALERPIPPCPAGWRAKLPKPQTLPHFPAVTHRGGFPDGS